MKNTLNIIISGPPGYYGTYGDNDEGIDPYEDVWYGPVPYTLSGVLELNTERSDKGYESYILTASSAEEIIEMGKTLYCSGIMYHEFPETKTLKISTSDVDSIKVTP